MPSDLQSRAEQVLHRCQTLARLSEDAGSIRRTFLSAPMRDCHREIAAWLAPLGVTPSLDAVGNLRALYPAATTNAPRVLIGSHLDTVPNAGPYDGILGVVLAVALLESLDGKRLPFAIELVAFSEEEGVRFGFPFIGSLALVGRLGESYLAKKDASGISVREAIEDFGLDPAEIPRAAIGDKVLAFLEFHIEQGPVLESLSLPLAVVDAIVGQSRIELHFRGRANHAGTTPMHLRHDALTAAAEWIVAVEQEAQRVPGLVATCGSIQAAPGTTNVIPGEVRVSLDIRHASDDLRAQALAKLRSCAEELAARRKISVSSAVLLEQPAVAMDRSLSGQIEQAIRTAGFTPHRMTSGAGHDAMILAERVPSAMIFLRSPGGISHHPAESVLLSDVEAALSCGTRVLSQLASSHDFLGSTLQSRTLRA
jgi:allantoate deiminase